MTPFIEKDFEMENLGQNSQSNQNFAVNFAPISDNSSHIQPTVQIQNPNAPDVAQSAREDFNIPTQIVEQARLIRTAENTEMVINLKPEHLGALTLKISVNQNGALTANFYSDNAQVRAIIENSLVQLKQELSDAGLKVENVQVYAGLTDGGLTNGQGQRSWQQNQQQRSQRRINFNALDDDSKNVAAPVDEIDGTEGVDYKV